MKYSICLLFFLLSCTSLNNQIKNDENNKSAKNVILVIVDGMGFSYLEALKVYQGSLLLDSFDYKTSVTTCSLLGSKENNVCIENTENVTDSAASATAIATGHKVLNKIISMKDEKNLKTILEIYKEKQKTTGIVATKLISDATPAAFAAHAKDRKDIQAILKTMFSEVMPTLILGADNDLHKQHAIRSQANYKIINNLTTLKELSSSLKNKTCNFNDCPNIYGGFNEHSFIPGALETKFGLPLEVTPQSYFDAHDIPHLSDMASSALDILSKNKNGFFLMLESSMPDMVGHNNYIIDNNDKSPSAISVLIKEMLELEKTIKILKDFVEKNPDTLLVLTADHETGGLVINKKQTKCYNQKGCIASASWTSKLKDHKGLKIAEHTNANVPLFALGKYADRFNKKFINNTDIIHLILGE